MWLVGRNGWLSSWVTEANKTINMNLISRLERNIQYNLLHCFEKLNISVLGDLTAQVIDGEFL